MQKALHLKTTVLPGGKIEVVDRELRVGNRWMWSCCAPLPRRSGQPSTYSLKLRGDASSRLRKTFRPTSKTNGRRGNADSSRYRANLS